ncbi:MAG: hypothetical protein WHU95_00550 [candidate division WOR-3 bacterium]|jgi:hypothetical protein|nr:hypothetical protein [candidate division WOR-3 bacterium]MDH7518175.1 hypothetical protein [bacterium]
MPYAGAPMSLLYAIVIPLINIWLSVGILVTVLYHLSLFFIRGEFRNPDELFLDIAATVIRLPLYLFLWPVIFFFDRSALHEIKLFLLWLEPKNREKNPELKEALSERRFGRKAVTNFELEIWRTVSRRREQARKLERQRRLKQLPATSPELNKIWLLIGKGISSTGAELLVRLFPDALLPEEINEAVKEEVKIRLPCHCPRCDQPINPTKITLPEPFYLEIIRQNKPLIAGWAYEGKVRQEFPACPKCGLQTPVMEEEVTLFGKANEVVEALNQGLSLLEEEPEPVFSQLIGVEKGGPWLRVAAGIILTLGGLIIIGILFWSVYFFITYFRSLFRIS